MKLRPKVEAGMLKEAAALGIGASIATLTASGQSLPNLFPLLDSSGFVET